MYFSVFLCDGGGMWLQFSQLKSVCDHFNISISSVTQAFNHQSVNTSQQSTVNSHNVYTHQINPCFSLMQVGCQNHPGEVYSHSSSCPGQKKMLSCTGRGNSSQHPFHTQGHGQNMPCIWASSFGPATKCMKTAEYPDVEKDLDFWLKHAHTFYISISGPLLMDHVNDLAKQLGHENFLVSTCWLARYKQTMVTSTRSYAEKPMQPLQNPLQNEVWSPLHNPLHLQLRWHL